MEMREITKDDLQQLVMALELELDQYQDIITELRVELDRRRHVAPLPRVSRGGAIVRVAIVRVAVFAAVEILSLAYLMDRMQLKGMRDRLAFYSVYFGARAASKRLGRYWPLANRRQARG